MDTIEQFLVHGPSGGIGLFAHLSPAWRCSLLIWLGVRALYALWAWLILSLLPLSVQNLTY